VPCSSTALTKQVIKACSGVCADIWRSMEERILNLSSSLDAQHYIAVAEAVEFRDASKGVYGSFYFVGTLNTTPT
jgi:hypothetical protein